MGENFNLDLLREGTGLLEDNLSEEQQEYKESFDQLKENYDFIKEMMKEDSEVDSQNPTKVTVASAKTVAVKTIESLPFIEENEYLKNLLEAAKTS